MRVIPVRVYPEGTVYAKVDDEDFERLVVFRWTLSGENGYAIRTIGHARQVRMHREILGLVRGDGLDGDHINRDRLDNCRSNLRVLPRRLAVQNRSPRRDSRSGRRGVIWDREREKWQARVTVAGKTYGLGRFNTIEEADRVAVEFRAAHVPYSEEARCDAV